MFYSSLRIITLALATTFSSHALGQESPLSAPFDSQHFSDEENLRSALGIQIQITVDGKGNPLDFYTLDCEHPLEQVIDNFFHSLSYNGQEMQVTTRAAVYNETTDDYDGTASIVFHDPIEIEKDHGEFYNSMRTLLNQEFENHLQNLLKNSGYRTKKPPPQCAQLLG